MPERVPTRRIIDSHAHVFPFLGGPSGYPSSEEHLAYIQWALRRHVQPVRRLRDNAVMPNGFLLRGEEELGRSSLAEVGFRAANYGRFEWTVDGEDYYLQFMPPSLQSMQAPPEFLIALMDYAGVDVAVLQDDGIYGRLNAEFADSVARWPDRFIALAQVNPDPDPETTQCMRLQRAIQDAGFRGLFFKLDDFYDRDFSVDPFGPAYTPLWDLVSALGIPVFWHIAGVPTPSVANYLRAWERFAAWLDRYPDVTSVMVGGISLDVLLERGMPEFMQRAIHEHDVLLEVLFPIIKGGEWRYPYAEAQDTLRSLYNEFGATRLVWGSDIPNVERYSTYRQSLDYLTAYDFISEFDLALILGGNLERVFGLEQQV
jgi:predicted TIM-barrel fold metal-dependent hydrolase